jgi:hypothetical protein
MDVPTNNQITVRCPKCYNLVPQKSVRCEHCGFEFESNQPKSLFVKIKRLLGIDLSSDIVTINLEERDEFLTNQEIDSLLDMENVTVLGLEDVPDHDSIFYKSKRVRKPTNKPNNGNNNGKKS